MDYLMGRESLKQTLSQQVRLLEHDYIALSHSSTAWNDIQARNMDTLVFNIQRLISSINTLPDAPLSHAMRHDLRNQLTTVLGFAQILMHRRTGDLSEEAMSHLQSIVLLASRINDSLDEAPARNG